MGSTSTTTGAVAGTETVGDTVVVGATVGAVLGATFTVGALWAGAAWAKRGTWQHAALLGLLCGAGLYAKLLFIWIIGGAVGALSIINLPILIRYAI